MLDSKETLKKRKIWFIIKKRIQKNKQKTITVSNNEPINREKGRRTKKGKFKVILYRRMDDDRRYWLMGK